MTQVYNHANEIVFEGTKDAAAKYVSEQAHKLNYGMFRTYKTNDVYVYDVGPINLYCGENLFHADL